MNDVTLTDALDDLRRRGFSVNFGVVGQGLRAVDSGQAFRADELIIREYVRFEGISDPDDMAIVYAIESRDGTRGTLVDAFGVYANPAVGAFLEDVPIRRGVWPETRGSLDTRGADAGQESGHR